MTLTLQAESPPLRKDAKGAVRIAKSRVLLELVINAFEDGATAEAIVQRYPTLKLPDVYSVIAYYLRHRIEVDKYLQARERKAGEIRRRITLHQADLSEIRNRLQAARQRRG